jgi:PBSX family phage terminase large subunit
MFRDVLGTINKQKGLDAKPNLTDLTYTLPNESCVYLLGMDSKPEEAEKALGQKFKKVIVDEAGSFRRDLRPIIYGILAPACVDLGGTISMIGTPTNLTKGLFYDVVWNKTEPGWSMHQWTAYDNPFMYDAWTKEIDDLKARNPLVVETPWFKQMYQGEYVVDTTKLVYRFSEERNILRGDLPSDLIYVLGVDLGYDDPSAFVLCGYSATDPTLYIIDSYKKSGMIISDVAERIRYYERQYKPYKIIVDGANKQAVEEMKVRYQLNLTTADKAGKAEFIEIMNSELIQGRIKSLPALENLFDEYANLIWDERSDKRQEHSSCENHLTDAMLYAWRYTYQYISKPKQKILMTDEQKVDLFFERESAKVMDKTEKPFWERDFE